VHTGIAFAMVMIARRIAPPDQPAAEMITMVFEPPASEPVPVPSAVPAPPVPEPVATPPPLPEPPAEPHPTPEPPPLPEPPQPPASAVTTVLPELPPLPLAPMPEPNPIPLPPPPTPPPQRRPAREPARSQSAVTRPAAPPVQPPLAQDAAAAPTTVPATAPPQAVVSADWRNALGAWLQAHKTYPEEAKRRGDQGRAIVRFTVDHDGHVLGVHLVSGTGSALLDAAVEQLLRDARLPAFPPSMTQAEVTVSLQIRYSLER
jgi:periplasmic protein TonB